MTDDEFDEELMKLFEIEDETDPREAFHFALTVQISRLHKEFNLLTEPHRSWMIEEVEELLTDLAALRTEEGARDWTKNVFR